MKILVADDDLINRRLLETFLKKWSYDVVLAGDGEQAWNILRQEGAPKLAILDWIMPGMDGPQICRELRKRGSQPYTYVLLLTANFQKEDVIAGLEAGADDYLTKPFHTNELRARLRSGRRILALQEQLIAARDVMEFHATHDSLTGLQNRASILETLRSELARARREGSTVGVLMGDLDHFKNVNDTYGHLVGDAVLREAANRLRSCVRTYDSIGRYGGEEFLVVLPSCDSASAVGRADQLRIAMAKKPMDTPEGLINVTLSLGVTTGGGPQPPDISSLLRAADGALYEAKKAGRNQVELAAAHREQLPGLADKTAAAKTLATG